MLDFDDLLTEHKINLRIEGETMGRYMDCPQCQGAGCHMTPYRSGPPRYKVTPCMHYGQMGLDYEQDPEGEWVRWEDAQVECDRANKWRVVPCLECCGNGRIRRPL